MASRNERHVVPNPEGGWDVTAPGGSRASAHLDTQAAAQTTIQQQSGSQVVDAKFEPETNDSEPDFMKAGVA